LGSLREVGGQLTQIVGWLRPKRWKEKQMAFDKVLALFKFGKREHIEQFINNGLIYMNSASYLENLKTILSEKINMKMHPIVNKQMGLYFA